MRLRAIPPQGIRRDTYATGVTHRSPGSAVRGAPWVTCPKNLLGRAVGFVYRENTAEAETGRASPS
jgi:hypothetical protein